MAEIKYNEEIETIWESAPYCNCEKEDCKIIEHRLCDICSKTILYGAHESIESQRNNPGAWNFDQIIAKSNGGGDGILNLQAVHINCNRDKTDQ
jgi:5-methylcytosine-specific restriction endonuclease McrA